MAEDLRRDKGSGSIKELAPNKYIVRYKGFSISKGLNTKAKAVTALKQLVNDVDNGILTKEEIKESQKDFEGLTVGEWLDLWLRDYAALTLDDSSYDNYERNIRIHLKPRIGSILLTELTAVDIQNLYSHLHNALGLEGSTILKIKHPLSGAIKQALLLPQFKEIMKSDPFIGTKVPKTKPPEIRVMSIEEQSLFMDACKGHRLEAFFLFALATGMRKGELLALEWKDIDFEKMQVNISKSVSRKKGAKDVKSSLKVGNPKTYKSKRNIPLLSTIVPILEDHRKRQEKEISIAGSAWNQKQIVFCSTVGSYIEPRRLKDHIENVTEAAGIEHITVHALRHTFVCRCLEKNVSIKAISEILGHKDVETTLKYYAHLIGTTQQDQISRISDIFEQKDVIAEETKYRQIFHPKNHRKRVEMPTR